MKIDFNETECAAMEAFAHCDAEEGRRLQDEFLMNLKASIKRGEAYCSCPADCNLRGNCVMCVSVHRGHGQHLPYCLQLMVNKRLSVLSELTEHTITEIVEKPAYLR